MRIGTIFIQPHSDDAVMSSYFLIKAEILPRPYYLLTVFGQSNWIDPIKKQHLNYIKNNDCKIITRLRKNEDKKFAELFNLFLLFNNLKDCLLRHGQVFYRANEKLDTCLIKEVLRIINNLINKYNIKNIVVPFPYGTKQHYDHRIVYESIKLLPKNIASCFFVDDIPYSRIGDPEKYSLKLYSRVKIVNLEDKFKAMKIYDSQMCRLFFRQVKKIAQQNKGYERLFIIK
jgi:LmbE family N-acetylglucosaminyl deacetylase